MPSNSASAPHWRAKHDHQQCIEDALASANAVCGDRGARLTPLRRRVLELIWESQRPIGAYALLDALKSEHGAARPPTIYRALDFLIEQGLVHRIQSLNAFIGCTDPAVAHSGLFLICIECGDTVEIEDEKIDAAIQASADGLGFAVSSRMIEASGVCPECQAA